MAAHRLGTPCRFEVDLRCDAVELVGDLVEDGGEHLNDHYLHVRGRPAGAVRIARREVVRRGLLREALAVHERRALAVVLGVTAVMLAIAFESIVKLVAFASVGVFALLHLDAAPVRA